jgi:hypothetical protein
MKVVTLESIVSVIRKRRGYKGFLHKFIEECKIIDAIPIKEGATNGDMIKFVFNPVRIIKYTSDVQVYFSDKYYQFFGISWWNAPYKEGSENE